MESTIPFHFYLILLLVVILGLSILYIYYLKRGSKKEDNAYVLGLKYMAEGENRLAVEKFKEAVRDNSDNVDAYLKIGIVLRNEGLLNNAIRIHKELTLRGNLKENEKTEVKRNLALDYWQAGDYNKAEIFFKELKSNKQLYDWVAPYLLKIYEERNDWKSAFEIFQQNKQSASNKGKLRLAMYKVREGSTLAQEGEEKSARILYKEALKIDPTCAAAYIYLGDSYWREERKSDAIHAWTDLIKKNSNEAHLAFERLEKAWYEKGQFSKIEELYQRLLSENEDYIHARLALSDIYRKKGEYNQSLKLLEGVTKEDQYSNIIKTHKIKVLMDQGKFEEASKIALELIEQRTKSSPEKEKFDIEELELS